MGPVGPATSAPHTTPSAGSRYSSSRSYLYNPVSFTVSAAHNEFIIQLLDSGRSFLRTIRGRLQHTRHAFNAIFHINAHMRV